MGGKMSRGYPKNKRHKFTVPTTPSQVLKRIMNDLSKIRKRSREEFEANKEIGADPNLDIEMIRKVIQNNFKFLGVNIKQWMKENT
jgi:hypothetical protein